MTSIDVVSLGYDVDTSQVLKGDKALDQLTSSTLNAERASGRLTSSVNQLGARANASSRALNGQSLGLRNLGLQLNQVAQQTAVTGNFFQSLSIQLPDILLGFGSLGIAAGIVAGALGPVALNLLNTRDAADDLEAAMDNLSNVSDRLQAALDVVTLSADDLSRKFGVSGERVRDLSIALTELAVSDVESALRDQAAILVDLIDGYTGVERATRGARAGGGQLATELNRITQDFRLTNEQAREFQLILNDLEGADGFAAQQEPLREIVRFLEETNVELKDIPPELQDALQQAIALSNQFDELARSASLAAAETSLINLPGQFGAPPQPGDSNLLPPAPSGDRSGSGGRRRGGGGGARQDPFESNLNRLIESLRTEQEVLEQWYAESEALLNDHRTRKVLGEEEHKEQLLRLEEEYQKRRNRLENSGFGQSLSASSSFFTAAGQLAQAGNSNLLKIAQAFGAAEATINAYRAASQALSDPSVPFFAKAAAFATTLATGIGAVRAIQAVGSSGSSGFSSTSFGSFGSSQISDTGISATEPAQEPRRIVLDVTNSKDWIALMLEDVLKNLQDASDEGVIIEVARRD